MSSLKHRFPAYSRMLRLYPRAYYRQYAVQMLQTLADILDDPDLDRATKTKMHIGAWIDLGKSIPRQRLLAATRSAAHQPNNYLKNRSLASLLQIAPIAVTFGAQLVLGTYSSEGGSSNSFLDLWFSRNGVFVWLILLPLIATLNALYALAIWYAARQKWPKSKRPAGDRWGTRLSLAGLLLISLAGMAFLGSVATMQYVHTRNIHRNRILSTAYQQKHLTLPCALLPLASAQQIMGTQSVYMDNSGEPNIVPYSGTTMDEHDQRVANCTYEYADESKMRVVAVTHEAFSLTAQQAMHDDFLNQAAMSPPELNLQPITLVGYSGFYSQQPQISDLSLWVKGYWLDASAASFESASQVMQTMVKNLDKELAAKVAAKPTVSARQTLPLHVTKPSLSTNDQTQIEYAIMAKNVRVPAGTELHADVTRTSDNQASGTFTYSTGLHGTFSAQKKTSGWSVTAYKEYKK